ncbi:nitroreductase family protein [Tenggerimyces flavus]|uniref:Nitroreductase family protein n=1 Tax=Tenggerimyces flavus TaxID=1708749 RepID=A0ABV7YAV7_9ACTN|nr:nitroreductase family protein [Tenggerimyces flavus]MBM7786938.1 nitroreductase [Tenggerimyces flavus]
MEFSDVVLRRRMVRNFADRPVDPEVVQRVLTNALHAPSAGFSQGWGFLVLDTPEAVARFWAATVGEGEPDRWMRGMRRAPVLIVALSNKSAYLDRYAEPDKGWTDRDEARWPVPYWHIDTGMAALLMLLTATDEGLGACFFGVPAAKLSPFRTAFSVPEEFSPVGVIALGHRLPDTLSPSLKRGRRPLGEVVHRGGW